MQTDIVEYVTHFAKNKDKHVLKIQKLLLCNEAY